MKGDNSLRQEADKQQGQWGFFGVDLSDSFVLAWRLQQRDLCFDLECSLWPDHPLYESPLPDHYTCYKRGVLRLPAVEHLVGLRALGAVEPIPSSFNSDADDYGCIDVFEQTSSDTWHLEGEFGEVQIICGTPILCIRGAQL
ncbi:MAG: hypothetical protein AAGH67_08335 [Cyanobacteria bacterium P01_H01_bin.162]